MQAADLWAFSQAQASTSGSTTEQQPRIAFDRVLLDVPCSGLGVLAKRADLRWRRSPADVASITRLQVGHAAGLLWNTWSRKDASCQQHVHAHAG